MEIAGQKAPAGDPGASSLLVGSRPNAFLERVSE